MAPNSTPSDHLERIVVQCRCGKRVSASPKQAGKRVMCPTCGQMVLVPEPLAYRGARNARI